MGCEGRAKPRDCVHAGPRPHAGFYWRSSCRRQTSPQSRDAIKTLGGDPGALQSVSPPAELVIDHSVQVDEYGTPAAYEANSLLEFQRNRERYAFLKWGQSAFRNFSAVPPGMGICHQVNLEYLARVVFTTEIDGQLYAYPDTLVGTDSHTTMINGLGVLGWGVGGIEAEAAMLGQPVPPCLFRKSSAVKLTRQIARGRNGYRSASSPSRRRCASLASSANLLSSTAQESRSFRSPTAPPSATWRPSTAQHAASSLSTLKPSATCASPAAAKTRSNWSRLITRSRAYLSSSAGTPGG